MKSKIYVRRVCIFINNTKVGVLVFLVLLLQNVINWVQNMCHIFILKCIKTLLHILKCTCHKQLFLHVIKRFWHLMRASCTALIICTLTQTSGILVSDMLFSLFQSTSLPFLHNTSMPFFTTYLSATCCTNRSNHNPTIILHYNI